MQFSIGVVYTAGLTTTRPPFESIHHDASRMLKVSKLTSLEHDRDDDQLVLALSHVLNSSVMSWESKTGKAVQWSCNQHPFSALSYLAWMMTCSTLCINGSFPIVSFSYMLHLKFLNICISRIHFLEQFDTKM